MKKITCSLLLMTGVAAFGGGVAQSSPGQFVTFSDFNGGMFKFLNSGSAIAPTSFFSILNLTDNSPQIIPHVTFQFLTANGYGAAGTPIDATLKVTASTDSAAQSLFSGKSLDQQVDNLSLWFIADTAVNGKTDLLYVTASTEDITGATGGTTARLSGSDKSGNNVVFMSDFLDFSAAQSNDGSLGLTLNDPLTKNASDGYLNTFTSTGTGNFSAAGVTPAPEAGSLEAFAGLLTLGGVLMVGRRVLISFRPTEG